MFNFAHTEQELRLILSALEELPHKISRGLIDKLVKEANEQAAQQPVQQPAQQPTEGAQQ
jgi:hypothetical protein